MAPMLCIACEASLRRATARQELVLAWFEAYEDTARPGQAVQHRALAVLARLNSESARS